MKHPLQPEIDAEALTDLKKKADRLGYCVVKQSSHDEPVEAVTGGLFEIWLHGTEMNPTIVITRNGEGFCQTICGNDKERADFLLLACNSHDKLVDACENFREWWANHFDDFDTTSNGELLCLDNNFAAALAEAKKGQKP